MVIDSTLRMLHRNIPYTDFRLLFIGEQTVPFVSRFSHITSRAYRFACTEFICPILKDNTDARQDHTAAAIMSNPPDDIVSEASSPAQARRMRRPRTSLACQRCKSRKQKVSRQLIMVPGRAYRP